MEASGQSHSLAASHPRKMTVANQSILVFFFFISIYSLLYLNYLSSGSTFWIGDNILYDLTSFGNICITRIEFILYFIHLM